MDAVRDARVGDYARAKALLARVEKQGGNVEVARRELWAYVRSDKKIRV